MAIFPSKESPCGEAYSQRVEAALYCRNININTSNIIPQPVDGFYHNCANPEHQDIRLFICELFHVFCSLPGTYSIPAPNQHISILDPRAADFRARSTYNDWGQGDWTPWRKIFPTNTLYEGSVPGFEAYQCANIPSGQVIYTVECTYSTNHIHNFRSHKEQVHKSPTHLQKDNMLDTLLTPRSLKPGSPSAFTQLERWATQIYGDD